MSTTALRDQSEKQRDERVGQREADRLSRLRWLAREFFFSSTPFTSTTRRRLRFRDESTHGANVKSLRETLPLQQDYL